MAKMLFYWCALVFIADICRGRVLHSLFIPSYLKPCNLAADDFENCAKNVTNTIFKNFAKGEKLLQLATTKRFGIPLLSYTNDNFTINCTNGVLHGFEDLEAAYIRKIPNGISAGIHDDRVDVTGDFSIDLWVGGEHIVGGGYGNISFYDLIYKYNFTWNLIEKRGVKFIDVDEEYTDFINTKTIFQIGEPGNPETDHINNVLNANSMEVAQKMYRSIYETYMPVVFDRIAGPLFKLIPYNFLFRNSIPTSESSNKGSEV